MTATIHHGDCLEVLRSMPDNSVDAVVTDPPYGLSNTSPDKVADAIVRWATGDREYIPEGRGFMGSSWDAFVPPPAVWDEIYRVLKPGGHLVAFAGSRTHDLMGISIRLSGMDVRDSISWIAGSGFPKSHNIGKSTGDPRWDGWGTALKPSVEPISLARKPLAGKTVAANTLEWGTGGLNIDATRITTTDKLGGGANKAMTSDTRAEGWARPWMDDDEARDAAARRSTESTARAEALGRWPANVVLDPDTAHALDQQSGNSKSKAAHRGTPGGILRFHGFSTLAELRTAADRGDKCPDGRDARSTLARWESKEIGVTGHNDEGGASRFFKVVEPDPPFMYAAKAPKKERPSYVNDDGKTIQHSTVKPLSICRWLAKLTCPPGGTILDPFAGSGTTIEAAMLEGFNVIGIEREADYLPLIQQRIDRANEQLPVAS